MAEYKNNFGLEGDNFARIKVIGIGGGGCNAVNRMMTSGVSGIDFIAVNTDNQSLHNSQAQTTIQIGEKVTRGLGAGANPSIGEKAAEESADEIARAITGTDMLFITAGMGGGTGTGAAPIVAKIAREMSILTVGVVTLPFRFEGSRRMSNAEMGLKALEESVDSLVVVPNDKLLEITSDETSFEDAFSMADQVLEYGVSSISDLVVIPGLINLDMADVKRVMTDAGICHMGIGRATGDERARKAVQAAIGSPLLTTTIEGAHGVILNFSGGKNMGLHEINSAAELVRESVAPDADIIFGAVVNEDLKDEMMITIIASDFSSKNAKKENAVKPKGYVPNFPMSNSSRNKANTDVVQEREEITSHPVIEEDEIPVFLKNVGKENYKSDGSQTFSDNFREENEATQSKSAYGFDKMRQSHMDVKDNANESFEQKYERKNTRDSQTEMPKKKGNRMLPWHLIEDDDLDD